MAGEKLDWEQKDMILDAFAAGYGPSEIMRMLRDLYDREIALNSVIYYRETYQKEIQKRRRRIKKKLEDSVPIARKMYRMKKLHEILQESLRWRLKRITPQGERIYEKKLSAALKALEQAAIEMEGKKIDITSLGKKIEQKYFVLPAFVVPDAVESADASDGNTEEN